jgi:hypothetical protein
VGEGAGVLTLRRIDPVHRITLGDRLELGQRRADCHREVPSAAQRNSNVLSEDWCPLLRRHCHEVNGASASLADNGVAMRGFDVSGPGIFINTLLRRRTGPSSSAALTG